MEIAPVEDKEATSAAAIIAAASQGNNDIVGTPN